MPVNFKGKEYMTVAERITMFRNELKECGIFTDIVSIDNNAVVFKAEIRNADGRILATGYAREEKNSSFINKTSYVENCETSAVGRALAFLGYGGGEIASADELINAINNQKENVPSEAKKDYEKVEEKTIDSVKAQALRAAIDNLPDTNKEACYSWIEGAYGEIENLTMSQFMEVHKVLQRKEKALKKARNNG